jgi:hypothetical protein
MIAPCRISLLIIAASLSPMFAQAQPTSSDSTQVNPLEAEASNTKAALEKDTSAESKEPETASASPNSTSTPVTTPAVSTPAAPSKPPEQESKPIHASAPKTSAPISDVSAQDLTLVKTMGQPFGEGHFSLSSKAHRLQVSASLDQPLSVAITDGDIQGHAPIFSTEILIRLTTNGDELPGSTWLSASIKPLGVSQPYPHADRLAQRGQVIDSLRVIQHQSLSKGSLRVDAGVVPQHLGRADSLYWTSFLPNRREDESLRLFDNALGVNTTYAYRALYTRLDLGQPIARNISPFASAAGLRVQVSAGWMDRDSKVVFGARADRLNSVDEQELNLTWQLSLNRWIEQLPITLFGELGSVTQPDVNEYALGSLYAHHEIALRLCSVQLKARYDWIDRDTNYKYDTSHLIRGALDVQVVKYVNLSAQYRHRWSNSANRSSKKHDEVMMFVHLVY